MQAASEVHEMLRGSFIGEGAARENHGTVAPLDQEDVLSGHFNAIEGCPRRGDFPPFTQRIAQLNLV
jgi:hypothetical protein